MRERKDVMDKGRRGDMKDKGGYDMQDKETIDVKIREENEDRGKNRREG